MLKLIFVFVFVTFSDVHSQRGSFMGSSKEPLCVKFDKYCELNADCCSKLCNTRSNKCIAAVVSEISTSNIPHATSEIENRFGDEDKPCQQFGTSCLFNRDCCSNQCSSDSQKCFDASSLNGLQGQETSSCIKANQQCSSTKKCCEFLSCEGVFCLDKSVVIEGTETFGYKPNNNSIDNRFGEGEKTNQTQPTNDILNSNCGEIGSKCYKESDCCEGLRCHGFLHQCVT